MLRIILTFLLLAFGSVAFAQTATERHNVETAFRALDQTSRETAQLELQHQNLYLQQIDGLWGAGTEQALLAALFMLNEIGTDVSVDTETDAQSFLDFIIVGSAQGLIFGEADEPEESVGLPSWLASYLSFDAQIADWRQATQQIKVASAANYYTALIPSDAQVQSLIQTGQLQMIAERIAPCMDEMIEFGVQTGQKRVSDPIYPDFLQVCAALVLQ
ncbi:hypothetical protein [Ruegeria atlantica]|uniref:Uncharacterized protein n=1 Tax=Ruegeria atlantica TaxID=81569 RepID=A0A0P1F448_9RHOB|nr:hypothetical protein [Ruegeria atlantica]CUH49803.1 hypothetical protein RUA4292_04001 [Ruegeria atlantica]